MLSLTKIFDVFSRRRDAASKPKHDVPATTRNRVLMWWSSMIASNIGADLK
jgi:hypothetical protein